MNRHGLTRAEEIRNTQGTLFNKIENGNQIMSNEY